MQPITILIIDADPGYIHDTALEQETLGDHYTVSLAKGASIDAILHRLSDVAGIISWHGIPLPDRAFAASPRCRVVVRAAVGFDNIDLSVARERGVTVCNVPDYGTEEVADHTLALLLSLVRNLQATATDIEAGLWRWQSIGEVHRLRGSTLGIVGFGRIGSAVAMRAKAFGMNVLFYDPYVPSGNEKSLGVERCEALEPLLQQADVLTLHAPLDERTHHLMGARELSLLRPGAILLNCARGGLVDTNALIEALDCGRLAAAGLDVLEGEPEVPRALVGRSNVLLSPHSAFYSVEAMREIRVKSALNIKRFFERAYLRDLVDRQVAPHPH